MEMEKKNKFEIIKKRDLPDEAKIVGVTTLKEVKDDEDKKYRIVQGNKVEFYKLGDKKGLLKGYVKIGERDNEYLEVRELIPLIILLGLLIGLLLLGLIFGTSYKKPKQKQPSNPIALETTQDNYVKPETPVDRSKNVTMPGWGGYTIPANTTNIREGFEFHNPDTNTWYADEIYYNGKYLENLIVDSGNKTKLSHLLKIANIKDAIDEVVSYDKSLFNLTQEEDEFLIEAISPFDEDTSIVVMAGGKEYKLDVKSKFDYYYMTFKLCLKDNDKDDSNDEVLYESGLVEPGMYIQEMNITRALSQNDYDAYVFIQPYRSDRVTKCNSGKVNLDLHVK